mmetsp:Transcript_17662/g.29677  ORF Transcript_17662/g.29677 Transcript_17662/m.29677 type:complete len:102 (+) Transcript_17662:744-1049(+)
MRTATMVKKVLRDLAALASGRMPSTCTVGMGSFLFAATITIRGRCACTNLWALVREKLVFGTHGARITRRLALSTVVMDETRRDVRLRLIIDADDIKLHTA